MKFKHLLSILTWGIVHTISAQQLQEIQVLYPHSTKTIPVQAEVEDDFLIIEGDIIVGTLSDFLNKGVAITYAHSKWPNGTIPYEIEPGHPIAEKIHTAIAQLNELTHLCITERTNENSYIAFESGNRCASYIGKIGNRQPIPLGSGCGVGTIIHEIMHSAGFYHEHTRADRDHYVTVHEEDIKAGFEGNFSKSNTAQDIGSYNYESIMHYGTHFFSKNGNPTITINMPPGTPSTIIGQRDSLSNGDITSINTFYPQASNCITQNLACHGSGTIQEMPNNWIHWNGPSVVNLGNAPSDPIAVGIFLSTNSYISPTTDLKLGEIILPSVPEGGVRDFDYQIDLTNIRQRYGNRSYYFGFAVDINNEINEIDESDNAGCPAYLEAEPETNGGGGDGSGDDGRLAVNLLQFSIELSDDKNVHLVWSATEEINFSHYEIERSVDSKNWENIHNISTRETNYLQQNYNWKDINLPKVNQVPLLYYRLKMIDKDDSFEYSNIKSIKNINTQTQWNIYPNPSTGNINIISSEQTIEHCLIRVTDFTGKLIYQINESLFSDKIGLNLSHLPSGIYWLQVGSNNQVHTEKIVLTK